MRPSFRTDLRDIAGPRPSNTVHGFPSGHASVVYLRVRSLAETENCARTSRSFSQLRNGTGATSGRLGSARVPRAGFGVAPKQSFVSLRPRWTLKSDNESSRSRGRARQHAGSVRSPEIRALAHGALNSRKMGEEPVDNFSPLITPLFAV